MTNPSVSVTPVIRIGRTALSWPEYVDGVSNLAHKIVDLTDCRALVCLVEMD